MPLVGSAHDALSALPCGGRARELASHARGGGCGGGVFLNNRGGRISRQSVHTLCERYGRLVGIEGLHPHTLRHSFATHMLAGGGRFARAARDPGPCGHLHHADLHAPRSHAAARGVSGGAPTRLSIRMGLNGTRPPSDPSANGLNGTRPHLTHLTRPTGSHRADLQVLYFVTTAAAPLKIGSSST